MEAIQNTQEVIGIWLETAKEDGWNIKASLDRGILNFPLVLWFIGL